MNVGCFGGGGVALVVFGCVHSVVPGCAIERVEAGPWLGVAAAGVSV